MASNHDVMKQVDKAVRQAATVQAPRGHMGASSIGDRCPRKVWYQFRWAYREQHLGRMLRLFERGHEEEARFLRYLRLAGAEVRDTETRLVYHEGSDSYHSVKWEVTFSDELDDVSEDPIHHRRAGARGDAPRQWGFTDHNDHFAGSCDGKISWPGVLPEGWGLLECKTINDRGFAPLCSKGVATHRPVHYAQMLVYMHYLKLPWALYLCVNKNNDEVYTEIIYARPEVAEQLVDRAKFLIASSHPPPRYSNDPSWFECKFCPFREICHYGDQPQKNCRSCIYASTAPAGGWYCNLHHSDIPKSFLNEGCGQWDPIR